MSTGSHALGSSPSHGVRSRDRLFERGDQLGRYEILFPLASGGRAAVYAARVRGEARAKHAVALKVMQAELAADADFAHTLRAETERASRVRHAAVVALREPAQQHEGALFVPMEMLVGVSVRELCDASRRYQKPLSPAVATALLVEAARGLSAVHAAKGADGRSLGLVHGDVSSQNVLVGADGHGRVSDFGMAGSLTRASAILHGTEGARLSYASPEQMRGDALEPRSDVFSLGVVAWELYAGERLFDTPNPLTTAQRVAAMPIPHVSERRAEVPRAVADVIARALERDTTKRIGSAELFVRELTEASGQGGIAPPEEVARAVRELCGSHVMGIERALTRALGQPEGTRASDTSSQRIITRVRTTPKRGLQLVAGGVLLVAIAVFAMFRGGKEPTPEAQVARASAVREPANAKAPQVAVPAAPSTVAPVPTAITPEPSAITPEPSAITPEPSAITPERAQPELEPAAPPAKKVRAAKVPKQRHHARPVKPKKQTSVGARGTLRMHRPR